MRETLYSPVNKRLCELIKSARLESGITQKSMADKTGRTQAYISKFESNQLRLDVVDFIVFCTALKLDPAETIDELSNFAENKAGQAN